MSETAGRFWRRVRVVPAFPRDLRAVIPQAVPLAVVGRPRLRLATVTAELTRLGVRVSIVEEDRPLRACLFCRQDTGIIFLDATDPPDEQRFSLAHELAHFLCDYDGVRRRAEDKLGPAVLDVLAGRRPATVTERLHGVLRGVDVGPRVHLLGRDEAGRPKAAAEREAEGRADRLAFELLAPAALVQDETHPEAPAARLVGEFGLPALQAVEYAAILFPPRPDAGPLVQRLKKSC